MAIQFLCNLCGHKMESPTDNPNFFCTLVVHKTFQVSTTATGELKIEPKLQKKQFEICEECFNNKLPKELLEV